MRYEMQQETNEGASDSISRYSLNQLFEAKFNFMAAFFSEHLTTMNIWPSGSIHVHVCCTSYVGMYIHFVFVFNRTLPIEHSVLVYGPIPITSNHWKIFHRG